jgi:hypothetical protein
MNPVVLRSAPLVLTLLLGCITPAAAQLSIQFNVPAAQIGVNLGGYPEMQRVPGYPVYYAPGVNTNYFFYDGLYWIYERDNWYASSWYNGPWGLVDPYEVPAYVLRVPVRYYRHAPAYFRGWRADAPPRWGDHWGSSWSQRRGGWDRWDRKSSPAPAPLPAYQRNYRGDRYPDYSRQGIVHSQNYRYQPRESIGRRHFEERREQARSAPVQREQRRDDRRDDRREQRGETRERVQAAPAQRQEQRAAPAREQNRGRATDPRNIPERNLDPNHSGG